MAFTVNNVTTPNSHPSLEALRFPTPATRFRHSRNLNPPRGTRGRKTWLSVLSVDPHNGMRIIDAHQVRYTVSSKACILDLDHGPLTTPAWGYNNDKNALSMRN